MKGAKLAGANLTRTNFMWANLQDADMTSTRMFQTVFVEADMQNVNVSGADRSGAYLKYAKLDGTSWAEKPKAR
jgi:uncharacterized protein YjbI with pentapeptide repeats